MEREILKIIIQSEVAKILFTILENPMCTADEIKKITKIPTTSTYRAIGFLHAKKLISYRKADRGNSKRTKTYQARFNTINFLASKGGVKMVVK